MELYLKRQVIDFAKVGEAPLKTIYEFAQVIQMDFTYTQFITFYLQKNIIKTKESLFHVIDSF